MLDDNDMVTNLTELLDREKIRHVLARYCRGQDRQDMDALVSDYWPDGWDDHGMLEGTPEQFGEKVAQNWPALKMEHMLGQSYIEVHGNFANAETYFFNHNRLGEGQDQTDTLMGGRYNDRLEKRGDEWRILHRTVVYDWYRSLGPSAPWDDSLYSFGAMPARNYGHTSQDYSWELYANHPLRKGDAYPRGPRTGR